MRDANGAPADMTFEKKSEAQAYERKILDAKSNGVIVRPKHLKETFLKWSAEWLASKTRRPGTQETYKLHMRNHIVPEFGGRYLHSIEPSDVRRWIKGLTAKGLAARTVHLIYKIFRACINAAVRNRKIQFSPCVDIELPETKRKKIVPATREQVWALYEAMPSHARAMIMVGVGCGLRSGEAFGLCEDSIDLAAGTLTVRRQVIKVASRAELVDYTKTERSHEREVPLPGFVHRALLDHLDTHSVVVLPEGQKLMFRTTRAKLIRRDGFYKMFKRALSVAGLPEDFRFHDLRHTFASYALDQGLSKATVQLYMGHASEAELDATYHHQVKGAAARDRVALEAVFFEETADVVVPATVEDGDEESAA
ncbi:tyrosine-type recombinase/integrase [Kitasatospora sp. NPDC096147]|uniref:tyrosine-type recombinase/integrase n=1 Tax=Kitasatospora sp. NPDC096147 TaxID=3364093 RepID=UPI0037FC0F95